MTKRFLPILLTVALACPAAITLFADNEAAVSRNLDIFNAAVKELNTFYVDSVDNQQAVETALNAMLGALDPYTEYIPARDFDDFKVIATGEYGGVGSYIMEHDGNVYFSEPYENSPAARAGIHPGDKVYMIDGEPMAGKSSDEVSTRLKGLPGSTLDLTVVRPYCGDDSIKSFHITRETIKVDPVSYYGTLDGNIGYIKLDTFNEHSAPQVRDALVNLKQQGITSLMLDLRGNTGGIVDGAIQILSLFLPKGTQVLQTHGRDKSSEKTYKTTTAPIDTKLPLVVLINGSSASASEIVAGALQDLDRAVIVGNRSYGKGLVQVTRPLPYDGIIKLTVAKYYIPSGRLIQEIDYSNKNDTTKRDTTKTAFHTAAGRVVYEGGGISPDINIDYPEVSRIIYNIVRDNWAFNFSTKYAAEHPTIPEPDKFTVTDEIFNSFKQFIDPDRFEYDKVCETGLENLRTVAQSEGYMNDSVKAQFDALAIALHHDLGHDLDNHRDEISQILAQEILKHYYFQKGQTVYALHHDKAIDTACALLLDPARYRTTLHR